MLEYFAVSTVGYTWVAGLGGVLFGAPAASSGGLFGASPGGGLGGGARALRASDQRSGTARIGVETYCLTLRVVC